jgi:hypothetical protein
MATAASQPRRDVLVDQEAMAGAGGSGTLIGHGQNRGSGQAPHTRRRVTVCSQSGRRMQDDGQTPSRDSKDHREDKPTHEQPLDDRIAGISIKIRGRYVAPGRPVQEGPRPTLANHRLGLATVRLPRGGAPLCGHGPTDYESVAYSKIA